MCISSFFWDTEEENEILHASLFCKLKAHRQHPRDYPQRPTGYRHTAARAVTDACGR